jgi:hypothetical protein
MSNEFANDVDLPAVTKELAPGGWYTNAEYPMPNFTYDPPYMQGYRGRQELGVPPY